MDKILKIKVILNSINLGFSKGNNWGIKNTMDFFDFIVVMNNDTEILKKNIANIILEEYQFEQGLCEAKRFSRGNYSNLYLKARRREV